LYQLDFSSKGFISVGTGGLQQSTIFTDTLRTLFQLAKSYITEWWLGNDVQGNCSGLFESTVLAFPRWDCQKNHEKSHNSRKFGPWLEPEGIHCSGDTTVFLFLFLIASSGKRT